MSRPGKRYAEQLAKGSLQSDSRQQPVVDALDDFYRAYVEARPRWRLLGPDQYPLQRGIYLWGGVGRGKTWLADLLYDSLPGERKRRTHYHAFMREIHALLSQHQGRADPLPYIAGRLSRQLRVLFLDEFHVIDIADAVILAQLLSGLFTAGVSLVTTSNVPPEGLYPEGIQRASFLPAIDLLKQHTRVLELGGSHDYRSATLQQQPVFLVGDDAHAEQQFQAEFDRLAGPVARDTASLVINQREVPCRQLATDVVWFYFPDLCLGPRHASDYLEIARQFSTVFLQHVPVLDGSRDDCARRFISMIDIFYDHRVKLVISAEAPAPKLYSGERLAFEFQRTASRLLEMQSTDYLARAHRS